jgi:hypothetical protein
MTPEGAWTREGFRWDVVKRLTNEEKRGRI